MTDCGLMCEICRHLVDRRLVAAVTFVDLVMLSLEKHYRIKVTLFTCAYYAFCCTL